MKISNSIILASLLTATTQLCASNGEEVPLREVAQVIALKTEKSAIRRVQTVDSRIMSEILADKFPAKKEAMTSSKSLPNLVKNRLAKLKK